MKVVIPVAGLGTRLRPHTYSKPKPLVHVAGKPVLGHILDQLKPLDVEEIVFITGYLGNQIEEYVRANYKFPVRFVAQTELKGQAHAIHLAADAIDQPVLIVFVDTIIKADLEALQRTTDDGVLFVHPVEDPRRFGVAVLENGYITKLVEKPREPVSNLAVVGVYYLRNWQLLNQALREVIERDVQTAGEYYLADALQIMIDHGARLRADSVSVWEDCGTLDALLQTNRYMLGNGFEQEDTPVTNSILIPPCYIDRTARIENSIIGPNASIAENAVVTNSIVRDSIVSDGAQIVDSTLSGSLVGSSALVTGRFSRLNVGDLSQIDVEQSLSLESYEVVIGLEVHAELLTESKMYCPCANQPGAAPNHHVCPVCLGLPGALPVINQRAVELTALTGLALNCSVSEMARFDRKNYFYPDLLKGYQISQFEQPIARNGWLDLDGVGGRQRVGIRRVHLEEDTAKLAHRVDPATGAALSLVDVNRGGVPLMEIVSEPEIRTAEQAREYLVSLRSILQYLGASTGNMEEGSFRCDANLSIRPIGATTLGTKVEVKNMNSFRAVYRALAFEAERQVAATAKGERIVQETRGWDESRGVTLSQRSKEHAHDYRYFPEPDLPPLSLTAAWTESLRMALPELPRARRARFVDQYALSPYDADVLTVDRATSEYFEAAVLDGANPNTVANWLTGELFRLLNAAGVTIADSRLTPGRLAELIALIEQGVVSTRAAKDVFERMFQTGEAAMTIVDELGLSQISDSGALERLVDEALAANPRSVADYRAGKPQAIGFLVGQVMKASRGKANPGVVNGLLRERLAGDPSG